MLEQMHIQGDGDFVTATESEEKPDETPFSTWDWRDTDFGKSHSGRIEYFLDKGILSDVTLVLGSDGEKVKAHKVFLSAGSPIFEKLFSESPDTASVEIKEFEVEPFRLFLKYLYTGFTGGDGDSFGFEEISELLRAAEAYKVPDLTELIAKDLEINLRVETAVDIYQLAQAYKLRDELEAMSLETIWAHGYQILMSDKFLDLSAKNLGFILEDDRLEVVNEIQVFEAVMRWARRECEMKDLVENVDNLRDVLEDILPLIRFPLMEPRHFAMKVSPTKILSTDQAYPVILYLNAEGDRSTYPVGIFNTRARVPCVPKKGPCYIVQRLRRDENASTLGNNIATMSPVSLNAPQSIRFKCDSHIWINSIGVSTFYRYGNVMDARGNTVTMKVELKDTKRFRVLASQQDFVWYASSQTPHVKFERPACIEPGEWYTVTLTVIAGTYCPEPYVPTTPNGSMDCKLGDEGSEQGTIHFDFIGPQQVGNQANGTGGHIPEIEFMTLA